MSDDDGGREVTLHVYDLSQGLAAQLSAALTGHKIDGIWHSGVVVGGVEYYWGGELIAEPAGTTQYGRPVRVISLGRTYIPDDIIREFIDDVRPRFNPSTYSLLSHNCNNFSNELATFLTGHGIPEDIVGLPDEVLSTPFGQMIRPFIEQMERQQKSMYGTSATLTTPELAQQRLQQAPAPAPAPASAPAPAPSSAPAPAPVKAEPPKTNPTPVKSEPKESVLKQNHSPLLSLQRVYKPYIIKLRAGGKTPEPVLASIEASLSASDLSTVKADPKVVDFIQEALNSWPVIECLPVLYILRELVTVSDYGAYYGGNSESLDALCRGLERCGVEGERPAPCLLVMAAASNLFASSTVSDYLRSSESALTSVFFKTALKNMQSTTKPVRQMAAALVFNFTLEQLHINEQQISDIINGFCVALCQDPTVSSDTEFEQRCLLALGHFVQNHPKSSAIIVSKSQLHSYLMKKKDVPTISDISNEICDILSH